MDSLQTRATVFLDSGQKPFYSHNSAVIDQGATIGDDTKIWHFSHVMRGAVVGQRCNIGQNVMIGPDVSIGDDCKVQNNVSIYEGVVLEDNVFCGPSAVFTNVINPRSHIPRRHEYRETLVRKGATIGANATILCGCTIGREACGACTPGRWGWRPRPWSATGCYCGRSRNGPSIPRRGTWGSRG